MYDPDHPDADFSGFVSRKTKMTGESKSNGGGQMAELFSALPEPEIPKIPYVYDSGGSGLIGGPAYPDLGQYKSSAQAMQDGEPTNKEGAGKKKLQKSGPTIPISPVTGLPLCNYGDWAQKFDDANDPSKQKPTTKLRSRVLKDPTVESLKKQLASRGVKGLVGLQRKFKMMDDDGSGQLSKSEFKKGIKELALPLTDSELSKLFDKFDSDKSGSISFDELLIQIRGELNDRRFDLVQQAFEILDTDGSGIIDADEIAAKYDASKHPDVQSGKKSQKEVLMDFLQTFDVGGEVDGKVTFNEFVNYYTNIGSTIPSDTFFELMIRNAWHISGGEGYAANSSNLRVLITQADGTQAVVEVKNDLGIKNKNDPGFQRDLENRLRQQGLRNFRIAKTDLGEANEPTTEGQLANAKAAAEAAAKDRATALSAIEKLRSQLISRGATGICGLQRKFRIMDDDGSKSLDMTEFKKAMREMAIQLSNNEYEIMFGVFDRDKSGSISFDELLVEIRGPLSEKRKKLVHMAFDILDADRSGAIDGEEIATKYDASKHPDVISGKRKPKEVLLEFLHTFDVGGEVDGKVTREEFENYYANISASIDDDQYFELMIRNAWHLAGGEGDAACTSNLHVMVTRSDGTQGVEEVKNDLGMMNKKEKGFSEQLRKRLSQQGMTDIQSMDVTGAVSDDNNNGSSMGKSCSKVAPPISSSSSVPGSGRISVRETSSSREKQNSIASKRNELMRQPKVVKPKPPLSKTNPAPFIAGEDPRVEHPVIDKIRQKLAMQGIRGFVSFQRSLKAAETDACGLLDKQEFIEAFRNSKMQLGSARDVEGLFCFLDKNNKGVIFTEAFFDDVRGGLTLARKQVVHAAFDKLDDRWTGELEPNVLMAGYCADMHPQVVSGDRTESDMLTEFLETCDVGGDKKGKITKREFENYHSNLSACIDRDEEFETLLRAVWDLGDGALQLRGQRASSESRIMRCRQRSPPPPARTSRPVNSVSSSTDDHEAPASAPSIADRRQEIMKMPSIGKVPILQINSQPRELFSQAAPQSQRTTSTQAVDVITGNPYVSASALPKVNQAPKAGWMRGEAQLAGTSTSADPNKSETSTLEDIKSLKVKAMLSKSQRNYVQCKACLEEAYRQMVILYTKDHVECKKLADHISAVDVLLKKATADEKKGTRLW